MLGMFRVGVALSVEAVDGARDDLDVALVLGLARFLLLLLGEVFGVGITREDDLFAIR